MSLKIVALKSVAELFHVSIFLLDDRGEKFFVCFSFSSSSSPCKVRHDGKNSSVLSDLERWSNKFQSAGVNECVCALLKKYKLIMT